MVAAPRAPEAVVGALLLPPEDPGHTVGVVFFNRSGYLGMCGHGTIGVVATLGHLGRQAPGRLVLDTPAGAVPAELNADRTVTFWNVESFRWRPAVRVEVPGHGTVTGDVAWGGNWFFLTDDAPCPLTAANAPRLTEFTRAVRDAVARAGITGSLGAPIDHVELSGPARRAENDGRNFVLCPDGTYDRSPCGTGTSAKIACLAADGRLPDGRPWRQEGILGGVFEAVAEPSGGGVRPRLTGRAFITGDATLYFDPEDRWGRGDGE